MYMHVSLQVWNYGKSAERGASQCVMYLDDVEIYRGELREGACEQPPSSLMPDTSQSVMFTDDPDLLSR